MKRNRRKSKSPIKYLIIITSIGMLSLTGVGYAYWTDSVNTSISVSTGNIGAYLTSRDKEICNGLILTPDTNNITRFRYGFGVLNSESIIPYAVKNSGTIPIKINPQEISVKYYNSPYECGGEDTSAIGSIEFQISTDKQKFPGNEIIINKDQAVTIFIKVKIKVNKIDIYNCTLSIPYTQFNTASTKNENGEYEGWKKEVEVRFDNINTF